MLNERLTYVIYSLSGAVGIFTCLSILSVRSIYPTDVFIWALYLLSSVEFIAMGFAYDTKMIRNDTINALIFSKLVFGFLAMNFVQEHEYGMIIISSFVAPIFLDKDNLLSLLLLRLLAIFLSVILLFTEFDNSEYIFICMFLAMIWNYKNVYQFRLRQIDLDLNLILRRLVAYSLVLPITAAASLISNLGNYYLMFKIQQFLNNQISTYFLRYPLKIKKRHTISMIVASAICCTLFIYSWNTFYSILFLNMITYFLATPFYYALGKIDQLNQHNFYLGLLTICLLFCLMIPGITLDTILCVEFIILFSRLYLLRDVVRNT